MEETVDGPRRIFEHRMHARRRIVQLARLGGVQLACRQIQIGHMADRRRRPANRARPIPKDRPSRTRRPAGARRRGGNARGRETRRPPRELPGKTANSRPCRSSLSCSGALLCYRQTPASVASSPMNEYSPPAPSPVMAQYLEIREANPGCLLFFRMGDFFELFFDDAVAAAQALDIALTKRGRHDGADIPMCGVPVHTAETYLARLIRAGFKVAICEQIEDPAEAKKRSAKGPVRRAVVRVVTAGTLTEEGLLDARRHNYLAGLADAGGEIGLAWLDLSTGDFALAPTSEPALGADLARLMPGEILLPERMLTRPALFELLAEWKPP